MYRFVLFWFPFLLTRRLVQTDCCFVGKLISFWGIILMYKVHSRVSVV